MKKNWYLGCMTAVLLAAGAAAGCGLNSGGAGNTTKMATAQQETARKQVPAKESESLVKDETSENSIEETVAAAEQSAPAADAAESSPAVSGEQQETSPAAPQESSPLPTGGDVGENYAKQVALEHAGVSESELSRLRIKRDYEDGIAIYDVEFCVNGREYDYEITAEGANIISADSEVDDDFYYPGDAASSQPSIPENFISVDEAIAVALERIPGASLENVRVKLDRDDGVLYYEGEAYYDKKEYEFEINAYTGDILEWKEEIVYFFG